MTDDILVKPIVTPKMELGDAAIEKALRAAVEAQTKYANSGKVVEEAKAAVAVAEAEDTRLGLEARKRGKPDSEPVLRTRALEVVARAEHDGRVDRSEAEATRAAFRQVLSEGERGLRERSEAKCAADGEKIERSLEGGIAGYDGRAACYELERWLKSGCVKEWHPQPTDVKIAIKTALADFRREDARIKKLKEADEAKWAQEEGERKGRTYKDPADDETITAGVRSV